VVSSFDGLVGSEPTAEGGAEAPGSDGGLVQGDAQAKDGGGRFCDNAGGTVVCADFDSADASPGDLGTVKIDQPGLSQGTTDDDGGPVGTLTIVADPEAPSAPNVLRGTFDQFLAHYLYDASIIHGLGTASQIELSFMMRIDSANFPTSGTATTMQIAQLDLHGPPSTNGDPPYGNAIALIMNPAGQLLFQKSNLHDFPYVDLPSPTQPGLHRFFDVTMGIDLRPGASTPRFSYVVDKQAMPSTVDGSVFDAGIVYQASDFTVGLRDYGFATTVGMVVSFDNVVVRTSP
jgi:hypothetical protein